MLDPDPQCATRVIASRTITAAFTDVTAAVEHAKQCDVVTLEIEQIHPDVLEAASQYAPVRPSRDAIFIVQDRIRQKEWLRTQHFPLGAFAVAYSSDDVANAVRLFGASIAKSTHGGYDGRGQVRFADATSATEVWNTLGAQACVVSWNSMWTLTTKFPYW